MFRLTIRDVLWLMVVVGLSLGWFLHWRSWEANRPPAAWRQAFKELDNQVTRQRLMMQKLLGLKDGEPLPDTLEPGK